VPSLARSPLARSLLARSPLPSPSMPRSSLPSRHRCRGQRRPGQKLSRPPLSRLPSSLSSLTLALALCRHRRPSRRRFGSRCRNRCRRCPRRCSCSSCCFVPLLPPPQFRHQLCYRLDLRTAVQQSIYNPPGHGNAVQEQERVAHTGPCLKAVSHHHLLLNKEKEMPLHFIPQK